MNTQRISLDLSKSPTYAQMVVIGQGDASGTTIVADVYDNGQSVSLSGMSARFCMRFKDDVGFVRDSNCSVSGNQITYVVDETRCAPAAGRFDECYFEVLNGAATVKYSTSRFRVLVLRAADSGTQAAGTWDSDFEDWLDGKEEIISAILNSAEQAEGEIDTLRDLVSELARSLPLGLYIDEDGDMCQE